MSSSHFVFIPFIFIAGYMAGMLTMSWRQAINKNHSSGNSIFRIRGLHLITAFGIVATAFMATHILPFPGGAKDTLNRIGQQKLFDQSPIVSASEVYSRLEAMGESGRQAYARFTYTGDAVFPSLLYVFLIVLARYASERSTDSKRTRWISMLIPSLWLMADAIENVAIYTLIAWYPSVHHNLAEALAFVTQAKFVLLLASLFVPIILITIVQRRDLEWLKSKK